MAGVYNINVYTPRPLLVVVFRLGGEPGTADILFARLKAVLQDPVVAGVAARRPPRLSVVPAHCLWSRAAAFWPLARTPRTPWLPCARVL